MLEKFKEYKNKLISRFKRRETADKALNILYLGNEKIKQYFDVINPKVGSWEIHGKLKKIKENNPDLHKKFILSLGEKDENGKPRYKNIIDDTYRRIENRNNDINKLEIKEAKKLLDEVKLNSMNIFENLIEKLQNEENENMNISGFRISTLIKILRGDCFCFNTREDSNPRYIQFDKEYTSEENSNKILQYENSQEENKHMLISRRHVDTGADLDKMKDCLLKYRKFISYYLKEAKPYVATETWLNDTEFFKYYSDYLYNQGRDPQDKKTIRNLNLTKELSISGITLLPLTREGKSYEERRRDFVKDKENSLSTALRKYEESGKQLQEGMDILDLNKLK